METITCRYMRRIATFFFFFFFVLSLLGFYNVGTFACLLAASFCVCSKAFKGINMDSWKAFNLHWEKIKDESDYAQLNISSTQNPHRPLEKLLTKLRKTTKPEDFPDANEISRQMITKIGSFTESFFKQKPAAYVTNKYFTIGLTNTEEKHHILVNLMDNAPILVYQCDRKEQNRYVERCNKYQVLVNGSSIESHFTLHEVTPSTNYIAPTDTVYFFLTVGPSLFILESIVAPFYIHVNMRENVSGRNTHRKISVNSETDKMDESNVVGAKPPVHPPVQHQISDDKAPPRIKISGDPEDILISLNEKKRSIQQALEEQQHELQQFAKAIAEKISRMDHEKQEAVRDATKLKDAEFLNLKFTMENYRKYMLKKCESKEKEILVLEGEKQREIQSMQKDYESQIEALSVKFDLELAERLNAESANEELKKTNRNMLEWNDEMTKTLEATEMENKKLKRRIFQAFENLRITSDTE